MGELLQKLQKLNSSDAYPFHMPGHKRNSEYPYFKEAFGLDITEIEGFGDLYSDHGILEDLKKRAAKVYGAKRGYILVNGSTVGVLSAISAAVNRRGRILIGDNAHRSANNAAFLNELECGYITLPPIDPYKMSGGVSAAAVEKALEKAPDTEAVFITSPTYEGVISDIKAVAEVCHSRDKLLIVDSAHGAYLGFEKNCASKYNAHNAVEDGADIVVESLHKTLPGFTQTALMFVNGDNVDEEKLSKYLSIYQTSSPSYLFMAGISACLDFLEEDGGRFKAHYDAVEKLREEAGRLKNIRIAGRELIGENGVYGIDPYKLVIHHDFKSGHELHKILSEKYHLICELSADGYVLAMTSPMDREEGFERMKAALKDIDGE